MNTPRLRRSTVVVVGLSAVLSLVAVSCGKKNQADTATTAAPTTAAAPAAQTIVEIAAGNPDFSILVEAVKAAGLVDSLNGKGPFTVFAPTNEAFAAALTALKLTKEELLANTKLLTKILTYHVIAGEVMAADVLKMNGQEAATVEGDKVKITVDGEKVNINESNVVKTDIEASNGVIHVIDAVLVPPAM